LRVGGDIAGMHERLDCLIVGAGPAGLVAATYLARFRRRIAVVDAGASRARWIPTSHNCPGFPLGVSGPALLERMREQAGTYGVTITGGRIESLARDDAGFVARDAQGVEWRATTVILATGIVDRLPRVEGGAAALETAIDAGVLRLCAVCDAYEALDERIAVLGPADEVDGHADFLRTFSRSVDAIPVESAIGLRCDASTCTVDFADGDARDYDTLYPVLGGDSQSQLARGLGARVDEEGARHADAHLQTSVDGLYAIGDVVSALNQIAVAVGHAAIAATAIHNRLPPNPRG
jgi:thioredoxin reductase (NADPH)